MLDEAIGRWSLVKSFTLVCTDKMLEHMDKGGALPSDEKLKEILKQA